VNVVGTTQMLDAFTRHGHLPQEFVLTSSRAVYGEGRWEGADGSTFYPSGRSHHQLSRGEWGFQAGGVPATPSPHRASEIFPNPSSVYGSTKLAQEHVLKSWCSAMNVPATVLRLQNVYGPGQSPFNPYTGIINIFHKIAYAGGSIEVYEDGEIGRDFVFIDDVVRSILAALQTHAEGVRQLDVGTGKATTIMDAAKLIAGLHNAPDPVVCGKFRDGDIRWAVADAEPLVKELGVSANVDFIESGGRLVGEWLLARGYLE
jgi:dTDP-L-rhamnose 4-epimerase